MSKAHDPHWRYIALALAGEQALSRRALQNAITGRGRKEGVADPDLPQLTRYEWPHAIVKVHHHQLALARQWLPQVTFAVDGDRIPIQVATMSSSGTIKTLTDRLGLLAERGVPKDEGSPRHGKGTRGTASPRSSQRPSSAPPDPDRRASTPRPGSPETNTGRGDRAPRGPPAAGGPAPVPGRRRRDSSS